MTLNSADAAQWGSWPMATKTRKKRSDPFKDAIGLRGFFRLRITEDEADGTERIVSESPWVPNQVTNLGKSNYLCTPLANGTALMISRMSLGTGTVPAAADTTLNGELTEAGAGASTTRWRISVASLITGSTAVEFQATFNSSFSFVTTSHVIQNIAIMNDTSTGTIFAGATYATSNLQTNQNVQASYRIQFT
jgi:hypothetical protein